MHSSTHGGPVMHSSTHGRPMMHSTAYRGSVMMTAAKSGAAGSSAMSSGASRASTMSSRSTRSGHIDYLLRFVKYDYSVVYTDSSSKHFVTRRPSEYRRPRRPVPRGSAVPHRRPPRSSRSGKATPARTKPRRRFCQSPGYPKRQSDGFKEQPAERNQNQ